MTDCRCKADFGHPGATYHVEHSGGGPAGGLDLCQTQRAIGLLLYLLGYPWVLIPTFLLGPSNLDTAGSRLDTTHLVSSLRHLGWEQCGCGLTSTRKETADPRAIGALLFC